MIHLLARLLVRKALHPSRIYPEREKWRLRLEAAGYSPASAERMEAHRWALWVVSCRQSGMTADDPALYAAAMIPWFEMIWKASR